MFEDLREAFREALQNFKDELNRDAVPGTVDRLLQGMVSEVTDAKARLKSIEADLAHARVKVQAERDQVSTMARRREMAEGIGDEETARIAVEFHERHQERLSVYEQKVAALERESKLLSAEIEEMMAKVKDARARRDSLTAQAGRNDATEALGASKDLFDDFDRMAAKIDDDQVEADAVRDFDSELDDLRVDPEAPIRREEIDFDARLAELKRRMGQDD